MSDDTTLVADPEPDSPPPAKPRMSVGDKVRFALRGVGQTLITLGVVVLLFIVYEVWVTNWFSERENHHLRAQLEQQWAKGNDVLPLPGSQSKTLKTGIGIANLYIPRLGPDFAWTIVQGHSIPNDADLSKGPAHYGNTALPGQVGNFAVAGHRVGKGEPFLNLDHLRSGDDVIVETGHDWYIYQVLGVPAGKDPQNAHETVGDDSDGNPITLPGREIVDPSDGNVLLPVPDHPNVTSSARLMTMTTCNPKFTAENRMIVYAKLVKTIAHDPQDYQKPAAIEALYSQVNS